MPDIKNSERKFNNVLSGKSDYLYDFTPSISPTGDFNKVEGINVLIRSIRTLLMTPLGHYPFDPQYGSLLYKKIFEMADKLTQEEIEFEVRDRIALYDDRIDVESVTSEFMPDKKTLVVNIVILRNGIQGKVNVILDSQQTMFGLEDKITAGTA